MQEGVVQLSSITTLGLASPPWVSWLWSLQRVTSSVTTKEECHTSQQANAGFMHQHSASQSYPKGRRASCPEAGLQAPAETEVPPCLWLPRYQHTKWPQDKLDLLPAKQRKNLLEIPNILSLPWFSYEQNCCLFGPRSKSGGLRAWF